jgi:hypothetical protein
VQHASAKSVVDINREFQYLSWPYRVQETTEAGVWMLTDMRTLEVLQRTPPVEEAMAVHIMRAWMCGNAYGGNFDVMGQYLLGMLPDDANPY